MKLHRNGLLIGIAVGVAMYTLFILCHRHKAYSTQQAIADASEDLLKTLDDRKRRD